MSDHLLDEFTEANGKLKSTKRTLWHLSNQGNDTPQAKARVEELASKLIFIRAWIEAVLDEVADASGTHKIIVAQAKREKWLWYYRSSIEDDLLYTLGRLESELKDLEDVHAGNTREYAYIRKQFNDLYSSLERRWAFQGHNIELLRVHQPPELAGYAGDHSSSPVTREFKVHKGLPPVENPPDEEQCEEDGRQQKEEACLLRAVSKNPESPHVYQDVAEFYHERDETEKACRYWQRAVDHGLDDIEMLFVLLANLKDRAVFKTYLFRAYGMTIKQESDWKHLASLFESIGETEHVSVCRQKIQKLRGHLAEVIRID